MIGSANSGILYEIDPRDDYRMMVKRNLGWKGWGVAEFDETTRYFYYNAYGNGVFRIHVGLDGTFGADEVVNTTTWVAAGSPLAMALHRPSGNLIFWGSQGRVFRIDPANGTLEDLSVTRGEVSGTPDDNRVLSKWIYIGAVDAFAGINDAREGVWVYRLPAPQPQASTFDARCNAPGVVFCDPLDTEGPWGVDAKGTRRLMRNSDGTTGIPTRTWWLDWRGVQAGGASGSVLPRLDRSVKASGTGSLKLDYPDRSGSDGGGTFATNFSDDFSQQFGEGDTFYVQYRVRYDCDFIYFDCDPATPGYKTARRFYRSRAADTTIPKISIISTGDKRMGGSSSIGACTFLEVVTTVREDHILYGYHSCIWFEGFLKSTGESFWGATQLDFQPNGKVLGKGDDASPTCWWMPDPGSIQKNRWGYNGPDCFLLPADEWLTIQVRLHIGRWQSDRTGPKLSHVTIWAAREGEPQRIVISNDLHLHAPDEPGQKYGKIWLTPYMEGKDPTEAHPTAHIWYDELIVSRQFIADPA
jgi:hypothetical protein